MSTSERLIDTRFAKRLAMVSGIVPAALLAWDASRGHLGVNGVNFAIRTTGLVGLTLLTMSLAITPLRALTGWQRLIAIRRNLGVLGFAYIGAHFAIFFLLDRQASVRSTLAEIVMRRYLWFGTASLALMVPLALTSTDGMLTRLGAARWKRLHRLAYVIAIGGVVHYYMLVKSDVRQPLAFAAGVGVLLGFRVVHHYVGLRRAVHEARTRGAAMATSTRRKAFWSGELRISRIFQETGDVKTFRFVSPDGGPLPFTHVSGQYLNLALSIDGRRVSRSYTIASAPTRNAYCEISVKRAGNGYGSCHIHDTWQEGDLVKVSAPAGRFVFDGSGATRVVLIAGGIGITPMMSVIRSLTDRNWSGEMYLLFSIRTVSDFVFREELDYLQRRFRTLHVRTLVSRDPDTPWDGPRGQITREVIADFVPGLTRGPVMLCGPGPMMTAMRAILVGMGVPDAEVLQEAFISPASSAAADTHDATAFMDVAVSSTGAASIVFARAGRTAEISPDQTVLEAAEDAGVEIPFECRSGICGQCKTMLLTGRVRMEVEDALTAVDRSRGLILACQAHAIAGIAVDA
jgi:ferredoxin-NADP reductase/DMSO/TMAO reductase YedYZ heme-binding membrane subunit